MLPINQYIIDIHCHPTMKPFGKSFKKETGIQSSNPEDITSLWKYDPPTFADKVINNIATLTKFRQSDFSSSLYGDIGIIFTCLYPPEQGFFRNELGEIFSDLPLNLITGLGNPRINYLQNNSNYFQDLTNEYKFLLQRRDKKVTIDNQSATYKILSQYSDLYLTENNAERILYNIITIEGAHCFYTNWDIKKNKSNNSDKEVLENINSVKQWEYKPLFISLAHHFYNGLCGHAISLDKMIRRIVNQDYGANFGISELGEKVIHKLLEKPNRILIDIKHMNIKNRLTYYQLLNDDYNEENIPIVVSHGAVNGYKDASGNFTFGDSSNLFCKDDINFFDDELVRIAKSKGIFGIQLDERRIASSQMLWKTRGKIQRKKILFHWSKLVWNQIEHIAKVLDKANLPAWDLACIGSDYDGIINPIGGYWTEEDMRYLDDYLLMHSYNFMKEHQFSQKLDPEEIVYKFRCGNAFEFLKGNY